MEVIPAIDLRHGACVRLYQGDYNREEVFDTDPQRVANRWKDAGARWIHVVDLDGAAGGHLVNKAAIEEIVAVGGVQVEVGGGIRTSADAEWLFSHGVSRVVLGTVAIEDHELVESLVDAYPDGVAVSLDARDGLVTTRGWLVSTDVPVADLCRQMRELHVPRFVYTDVRRDGTLTEPNYEALRALVDSTDVPVVAAGGIASMEHLRRLREVGAAGAILGKAIYTGSIELRDAITQFGG